tara:strand:- start:459 stop:860 length:402 start_codon:yes stop_codon:yes gene_type:complete
LSEGVEKMKNEKIIELLPFFPEHVRKDRIEVKEARMWAEAWLGWGEGTVWVEAESGFSMQVVAERKMRLLTVLNHEYALGCVSQFREILEWIGSELIIDDQSVLAEINENGPQVTDVTGIRDRSSEDYDVGVV